MVEHKGLWSKTVEVGQMPQQLEVRTAEDDWTGLKNAQERRKLQNRLNQRIYRKRRSKNGGKLAVKSASVPKSQELVVESPESNSPVATSSLGTQSSRSSSENAAELEFPAVANGLSPLCLLGQTGIQELVTRYEHIAYQDYMLGSPRVDQVITLIQFNVFRALVNNTSTMGFTMDWLEEDAISPWISTPLSPSCPESLRPSLLQRTITHHPWIDLFPVPRMRDNLLLAADAYDEYALCNDLVDFCDVTHENTGLVVWGEPWDPAGWEVSEAFVSKWKWVIEGCDDLIRSTNYWRSRRGENLLLC